MYFIKLCSQFTFKMLFVDLCYVFIYLDIFTGFLHFENLHSIIKFSFLFFFDFTDNLLPVTFALFPFIRLHSIKGSPEKASFCLLNISL